MDHQGNMREYRTERTQISASKPKLSINSSQTDLDYHYNVMLLFNMIIYMGVISTVIDIICIFCMLFSRILLMLIFL